MQIIDLSILPMWQVAAVFCAAAVVIAVAGSYMTAAADRLADVTGLGEALFGAVLLGGATSLSGITTSVVAAYEGYAELAISNAIGGIAAQTTFLAVADIVYRQANLEHAAASLENLMQGALLSTLLAFPLLGMSTPPADIFGVHPVSVITVGFYLFGVRLIAQMRSVPLWTPLKTSATKLDEKEEEGGRKHLVRLGLRFGVLAIVVALAGVAVAQTGIAISNRTGLSETFVGGLFTAVATSLPELVTSIAAVRQGALTLAVGGVIGGNSFDVLFVAFADAGYGDGSIYHAITQQQVFIIALTLLLTGILLMGLLRREKKGIANIGFESFLVLVLYMTAFTLLFFTG